MQFGQTQSINISGSVTVGTITGVVNVTGTVAVSGGSVSISGTPNVNVTGGSITISSGSVSISAGTITNIVDNVTVQSAVETLYSATWNDTIAFPPQNITLTQSIQGLKVMLVTNLAANQIIEIALSNTTNDDQNTVVVTLSSTYPAIGNVSGIVIVPFQVAGDVGDNIVFTLTKLNATAGGNVIVSLIGVGESPAIRTAPGLPLSTNNQGGILMASATLAAPGTVALLAAPQAGQVIRIHRIVFGLAAAGQTLTVLGHTSGFHYSAITFQTLVGITQLGDDCAGMLVPNEGLDFVVSGGTGGSNVWIHYDLVNQPTII